MTSDFERAPEHFDSAVPRRPTVYVVGYVDEIHGEGGKECPGFVATHHELRQLARIWASTDLDFYLEHFLFASTSGSSSRLAAYSGLRLKRLKEVLGEDVVDREVSAVWAEARDQMGDARWKLFT